MNKKLLQHIKEDKLTFDDVVSDFRNTGIPLWNPDLVDYVIENGIKPRKFWNDHILDKIPGVQSYEDNFISYIDQTRKRRLFKACNELFKYSKDNLRRYTEYFNIIGDQLEEAEAEFEKVERELDTVPHSRAILIGLKRKIKDALNNYYSISFQINWILEDVSKVVENGR